MWYIDYNSTYSTNYNKIYYRLKLYNITVIENFIDRILYLAK